LIQNHVFCARKPRVKKLEKALSNTTTSHHPIPLRSANGGTSGDKPPRTEKITMSIFDLHKVLTESGGLLIGESVEMAATDVAEALPGKELVKQLLKRIPGARPLAAHAANPLFFKGLGIAMAAVLPAMADQVLPGNNNANVARARDIIKKLGPHLSIGFGHGIANQFEYERAVEQAIDDADADRLPAIVTATDGSAPVMVAWSPELEGYHPSMPNDSKDPDAVKKEPYVVLCSTYQRMKQRLGAGFKEVFMTKDDAELRGFRPAGCCQVTISAIEAGKKKGKPGFFEAIGEEGRALTRAFVRTAIFKDPTGKQVGIDFGKEILPHMPPEHWAYLGNHIKADPVTGLLSDEDYDEVVGHIRVFGKGTLEFGTKILLALQWAYRQLNAHPKIAKAGKIAGIIVIVLTIIFGIFAVFAGIATVVGSIVLYLVASLAAHGGWAVGLMALAIGLLFLCRIPLASSQAMTNWIAKWIPGEQKTVTWMKQVADEAFAFFATSSWFFFWLVIFDAGFVARISMWFLYFLTWAGLHYANKSFNFSWVRDVEFARAKIFQVLTMAQIALIFLLTLAGWPEIPTTDLTIESRTVSLTKSDGTVYSPTASLIPTPQGTYFLAEDVMGQSKAIQMAQTNGLITLDSGARFDLPGYQLKEEDLGNGKVTYKVATAPKIFFWEWMPHWIGYGPQELGSNEEIIARVLEIDAARQLTLASAEGLLAAEVDPALQDAKAYYLDHAKHKDRVWRWVGTFLLLPLTFIGYWFLRKTEVVESKFGNSVAVSNQPNNIGRSLLFVVPLMAMFGLWSGPASEAGCHGCGGCSCVHHPTASHGCGCSGCSLPMPNTSSSQKSKAKGSEETSDTENEDFKRLCRESTPEGRQTLGCPNP